MFSSESKELLVKNWECLTFIDMSRFVTPPKDPQGYPLKGCGGDPNGNAKGNPKQRLNSLLFVSGI